MQRESNYFALVTAATVWMSIMMFILAIIPVFPAVLLSFTALGAAAVVSPAVVLSSDTGKANSRPRHYQGAAMTRRRKKIERRGQDGIG